MPDPIVIVEGLQKTFVHMGRPLDVLRGIDLRIDQGEVEGLKAFGRHFLLKTSLARKIGVKVAVLAGLITQAEADKL